VDALYPIDIHAAATAIWTLSLLRERDERALPTAARVLDFTLRRLRRRDGRFAFQLRRRGRLAVPYIRWSDAHMLLALASHADVGTARAQEPATSNDRAVAAP
jgi:mannose/cellobiose epimerase-like protein (N-acyl-D-glucosamine 2-epimerase family)